MLVVHLQLIPHKIYFIVLVFMYKSFAYNKIKDTFSQKINELNDNIGLKAFFYVYHLMKNTLFPFIFLNVYLSPTHYDR